MVNTKIKKNEIESIIIPKRMLDFFFEKNFSSEWKKRKEEGYLTYYTQYDSLPGYHTLSQLMFKNNEKFNWDKIVNFDDFVILVEEFQYYKKKSKIYDSIIIQALHSMITKRDVSSLINAIRTVNDICENSVLPINNKVNTIEYSMLIMKILYDHEMVDLIIPENIIINDIDTFINTHNKTSNLTNFYLLQTQNTKMSFENFLISMKV